MATNSYPGDLRPSKASSVPTSEVQLPQYFLVRPGSTKHTASGTVTIPGPMVPLIPVDQLPDWIDIVGVPRELNVDQMRGLYNLGSVAQETECYDVRVSALDAFNGAGRKQQHDLRKRQCHDSNVGHISSRMEPRATVFTSTGVRAGRYAYRRGTDGNGGHNERNLSSSSKASRKDSFNTTIIVDRTRSKDSSNNRSSSNNISGFRSSRNRNNIDTCTTTEHPTASPAQDPTTPSNSYPIRLQHQAPAPPPTHPASRLLSTFASGVQYTPSQPTTPLPSSSSTRLHQHTKGSHNNGTSSVYCRHWCHHGKCKWDPFCRYQHVMPSTPEGLREVGLADLPRWWKNAMGMALGMTGGMGMGMGGWFGGAMATLNRKELRDMLDRWGEMMGLSGGDSGICRRETRRKGKRVGVVEKGRLEEVDDSRSLEMEDESSDHDVGDTEMDENFDKRAKVVEKVQDEKLVDI